MSRIIAMWSGPRNISTAMMRSWENRPDTIVWDEPLYAAFLHRTGVDHPGRDVILKSHSNEIDYEAVASRLVDAQGSEIFYQKHIAHHLLEDMDRSWMDHPDVVHCFLIRDPREVILSLHHRFPEMTLRDTGLPQQLEIFLRRRDRSTEIPPVVDARDVLENPRGTLEALCGRLDIPFHDAMTSWPSGPRESDGAWADWWYDSVRASTGFAAWVPREGEVPDHLLPVLETCQSIYENLKQHRIRS
ncbi:MAG: sulfotransferase family protein [Phycisphaerae bacterium]|nr:sulfotransferase family protein [Phycisphaerae bacterium]